VKWNEHGSNSIRGQTMADKFMRLVLTPAVQRAQDKHFGKHQVKQP